MQSQELKKFVDTILKEKNLKGVEQNILDKLSDELTSSLETQINRALVDSLTDQQLNDFEKLVDEQNTEKLKTYFNDVGVPVQQIVTQVMTRFRTAYLGS
jgi:hypothetical protein